MAETLKIRQRALTINGSPIETAAILTPSVTDTILLLHEALGSVSYWKDFPEQLALVTESNVLLYSRPGHGDSQGPIGERDRSYYFHQTDVVIPALLHHYSSQNPVLYGHSEGAGIAMLYAVHHPVQALVLESPVVSPGKASAAQIMKMAEEYRGSRLQERLALYHRNPDAVFMAWAAWALNFDEDAYPLRNLISRITCPILVLQGGCDPFGTKAQLQEILAARPDAESEIFPEAGHLPHRDQTDLLLARVAQFLDKVRSEQQPLFSNPSTCKEQP